MADAQGGCSEKCVSLKLELSFSDGNVSPTNDNYVHFLARPCLEHADAIIENFQNELKDTTSRNPEHETNTELDNTKPDVDNLQNIPESDTKTTNDDIPDEDKNNDDKDDVKSEHNTELKTENGTTENAPDITSACDAKPNDTKIESENQDTKVDSSTGVSVFGETTVQNTETGEQIKLLLKVEHGSPENAIAPTDNANKDKVQSGDGHDSDKSDSTDDEKGDQTVAAEINVDKSHVKVCDKAKVKEFRLSTDCVVVPSGKKYTGLKGKPSNPPKRRNSSNSESQSRDNSKHMNLQHSTSDINEPKPDVKSSHSEFDVITSQVDGTKTEANTEHAVANENTSRDQTKKSSSTNDDGVLTIEPMSDVVEPKEEEKGDSKSKSEDSSQKSSKGASRKISEATKKKRKEREEAIRKGNFDVQKVTIIDILSSDDEEKKTAKDSQSKVAIAEIKKEKPDLVVLDDDSSDNIDDNSQKTIGTMTRRRLSRRKFRSKSVQASDSLPDRYHQLDNGEIVPVKVEPESKRTIGIQTEAVNVKLYREVLSQTELTYHPKSSIKAESKNPMVDASTFTDGLRWKEVDSTVQSSTKLPILKEQSAEVTSAASTNCSPVISSAQTSNPTKTTSAVSKSVPALSTSNRTREEMISKEERIGEVSSVERRQDEAVKEKRDSSSIRNITGDVPSTPSDAAQVNSSLEKTLPEPSNENITSEQHGNQESAGVPANYAAMHSGQGMQYRHINPPSPRFPGGSLAYPLGQPTYQSPGAPVPPMAHSGIPSDHMYRQPAPFQFGVMYPPQVPQVAQVRANQITPEQLETIRWKITLEELAKRNLKLPDSFFDQPTNAAEDRNFDDKQSRTESWTREQQKYSSSMQPQPELEPDVGTSENAIAEHGTGLFEDEDTKSQGLSSVKSDEDRILSGNLISKNKTGQPKLRKKEEINKRTSHGNSELTTPEENLAVKRTSSVGVPNTSSSQKSTSGGAKGKRVPPEGIGQRNTSGVQSQRVSSHAVGQTVTGGRGGQNVTSGGGGRGGQVVASGGGGRGGPIVASGGGGSKKTKMSVDEVYSNDEDDDNDESDEYEDDSDDADEDEARQTKQYYEDGADDFDNEDFQDDTNLEDENNSQSEGQTRTEQVQPRHRYSASKQNEPFEYQADDSIAEDGAESVADSSQFKVVKRDSVVTKGAFKQPLRKGTGGASPSVSVPAKRKSEEEVQKLDSKKAKLNPLQSHKTISQKKQNPEKGRSTTGSDTNAANSTLDSSIEADDTSSISSRRSNKSASDKPKLFDFYQDNKTSLLQLKELLDALDSSQRYSLEDANGLAKEYARECFNSKKDNNALFHAANKQIQGYAGGKNLRQAVINHISDNRVKYQFMIAHHFKDENNYFDYCKKMSEVNVPYDEICILALADMIQRNITIITPQRVWSLNSNIDKDMIVVVMVAKNNVYGTRTLSDNNSSNFQSIQLSFRCWICKKKFATEEILKSHKSRHDRQKYKCTKCSRVYSTKFSLKQHIRTVHEGKLYQCSFDKCNKKFKAYQSLKDHILIHQNAFKYTCELCGRGYMKSDHFQDHLNRHSKIKPFSCANCSRSFTRKNELKRHLQRSCIPDDSPKVQCSLCGKMLKNSDCLRNHRRQVHEEGTKKKCPYCDEVYSYHASTIDRHIRTKHPAMI